MNIFNRFYDRKTMTLVRPFVYKNSFVGSEAKKIIVLLLIQVFFLLYSSSYDSVFVILSAVCASVAANLVSVHFFEDKFHTIKNLSLSQWLLIRYFRLFMVFEHCTGIDCRLSFAFRLSCYFGFFNNFVHHAYNQAFFRWIFLCLGKSFGICGCHSLDCWGQSIP